MPPPPWRWCFSLLLLLHASPLLSQSQCTTQCGNLTIPFPFHLNSSSCLSLSSDSAFSLFCINSSSLYLTVASHTYRLLRFFPDGVLLDFPNSTLCRRYNDLRSFPFSSNQYFAISADNLLDLYDCDDSSLCKPDCEKTNSLMPGCDGRAPAYPSCCYPLDDRSSWSAADGLAGFSRFGCRGFSSWVVSPESGVGMRGIKLEWGVPRNSTHAACAPNADVVNATSVGGGMRCRCRDGFSGDGFSVGGGCVKSACFKDGKEVDGNECYQKKHGRKKTIILAGLLTSTLCVVSLTALFLLKRSMKSDSFISEQSDISHKSHRSRLFTYHDLHQATNGFAEDDRLTLNINSTSTLHAGVLLSGSHVAIQKLRCHTETDLIQILFKLERLSAVSHRNMARIIGWCIDHTSPTPLVVYELPENGTFRDHLNRENVLQHSLDWHKRLNIAAETACLLAFLQNEFSPPIHHHDLQSGFILLDSDFSVKLAGFELHDNGGNDMRRNDVYSLGLVLVEMITGDPGASGCSKTLQKIKKGKVEEMVDPSLYYHEQTAFGREEIEIVADLAMRCVLFGGDGKVGMLDAARELVHLVRESVDRRGAPALEETFSNSSLLQMISMSPDSIHVPGLGH